jgi:hypothetical protein
MFLWQGFEDRSAVHEESNHDENGEHDVDAEGDYVVRRPVCVL